MILKSKLSNLLSKKLIKLWDKIYNSSNSEECLIMGSGSSIRKVDLLSFGQIPIITCGANIYLKSFEKFNCKLVNVMEPFHYSFDNYIYLKLIGLSEKNIEYNRDYNKTVKENKSTDFLFHISSFPEHFKNKNVSFVYQNCSSGINGRSFNIKNSQIKNFSGSFYACLTSAYLSGFKKCYLLGFDSFTLSESSNTRFYDESEYLIKNNINSEQKEFYKYLSRKMEIKVLTLNDEKTLLDALPINSKFKDITFQNNVKGIDLLQNNKKDLLKNVRDEWFMINNHIN